MAVGAMSVTRIEDGFWRWTAPHPAWNGATDWDEVVASLYCETPDAILVIDPLIPAAGPDAERFWDAFDRDVRRRVVPVVVLLTCRWHVRSARAFRERHAARVFAPAQTGASFDGLVTDVVRDEQEVVPGVTAVVTGSPAPNEECVYVLTDRGAAVVGDVLLGDAGGGLRVADEAWYDNSETERAWYRERLADSLERLLAYDLRHVFPGHGAPVAPDPADALRATLARHRSLPPT